MCDTATPPQDLSIDLVNWEGWCTAEEEADLPATACLPSTLARQLRITSMQQWIDLCA
jgi:hypothetical protein